MLHAVLSLWNQGRGEIIRPDLALLLGFGLDTVVAAVAMPHRQRYLSLLRSPACPQTPPDQQRADSAARGFAVQTGIPESDHQAVCLTPIGEPVLLGWAPGAVAMRFLVPLVSGS